MDYWVSPEDFCVNVYMWNQWSTTGHVIPPVHGRLCQWHFGGVAVLEGLGTWEGEASRKSR